MNFAVIDDSSTILILLENLLETYFRGAVVRKFTSSESFLEFHDINFFDCVITDLSLPGISGKHLAKYIKTQNKDIPIMLITGNASNSLIRDLFTDRLIDDYIEKPISTDVFIERVNSLIKKREMSRSTHIWLKDIKAGMKLRVSYNSIDYITTLKDGSKVIEIFYDTGSSIIRNTLSEFSKNLNGSYFYKVDKSLIINLRNIHKLNYNDNQIIFYSKNTVQLGMKRKFPEIEKAIDEI